MAKTNKQTLEKLLVIGLGDIRTSKNGVPHLVYKKKSIRYLRKTDIYRVFWPYPSSKQDKKDFKSVEKLLEFIK